MRKFLSQGSRHATRIVFFDVETQPSKRFLEKLFQITSEWTAICSWKMDVQSDFRFSFLPCMPAWMKGEKESAIFSQVSDTEIPSNKA